MPMRCAELPWNAQLSFEFSSIIIIIVVIIYIFLILFFVFVCVGLNLNKNKNVKMKNGKLVPKRKEIHCVQKDLLHADKMHPCTTPTVIEQNHFKYTT